MGENICLSCQIGTENLTYCDTCLDLNPSFARAELAATRIQNKRLNEENDVLWQCISPAADLYRLIENTKSTPQMFKARSNLHAAMLQVRKLDPDPLAEQVYEVGVLHA